MKYDRYGSRIKRALREGNKLKAIKAYLEQHRGEGLGLRDGKIVIDKMAERYTIKPNEIRSYVKCPICQYENENFYKGQCPRCLMYYVTSETLSPDQD